MLYRVFGVEGFGCPQCGEVMMLRAVSVLPPLAMTLLRAMNWRGPPMWMGFTDAQPTENDWGWNGVIYLQKGFLGFGTNLDLFLGEISGVKCKN